MKLQKGYIYIAYSLKYMHWYIIRQAGVRTWVAMNFTNLDMKQEQVSISYNAVAMVQKLDIGEYNSYSGNSDFRKGMFSILQYGKFKELEND